MGFHCYKLLEPRAGTEVAFLLSWQQIDYWAAAAAEEAFKVVAAAL